MSKTEGNFKLFDATYCVVSWRHDTQPNDTQHNNKNVTVRVPIKCDMYHNIMLIVSIMPNMLSVVTPVS